MGPPRVALSIENAPLLAHPFSGIECECGKSGVLFFIFSSLFSLVGGALCAPFSGSVGFPPPLLEVTLSQMWSCFSPCQFLMLRVSVLN